MSDNFVYRPEQDVAPAAVSVPDIKEEVTLLKEAPAPKAEPEPEYVDDSNDEPTAQDLASEKGWRPQEEWEGASDDWVDAGEFMYRNELMTRISKQTKAISARDAELDNIRQAMNDLVSHQQKVTQLEVGKAIESLKAQKAEAMSMDDHAQVVEIDEQLGDMKADLRQLEETVTEVPVAAKPMNPEVQEWFETNSFAAPNSPDFNPAKAAALDAIATQYSQANPNLDPMAVLNYSMNEFNTQFGITKQRRPSSSVEVDNSDVRRPSRTRQGKLASRLSPDQRRIGTRLVETSGIESLETYAKQLQDLGEI